MQNSGREKMGKKYLETKKDTLESSILGVWKAALDERNSQVNPKDREDLDGSSNATGRGGAETAKKMKRAQEPAPNQMAETNKNDKSDDGEGLDAVQPKAVKKKFKDRKDKDIDNDGDVDDSDKFLHKRRKAVSKAVAKEEVDLDDNVEEYVQTAEFKVQSMKAALAKVWGLDEHKGTNPHKHPHEDNEVEEGLENSSNPANKQHLCAKNVVHEEWGDGQCIATQHADPDEEGNVAWYDVMFEHGIEKGVLITELKVTKSEDHMHASYNGKKKKKEEVSKTETGKKAAAIDLKPKIDD